MRLFCFFVIMNRGFSKAEKLKSVKLINELFGSGESFKAYPFVIIYKELDKEENHQTKVGFSVPKKRFKKAVDRNIIKRKMKEAYRLNKGMFPEYQNKVYVIMFVYIGKKALDWTYFNDGIKVFFQKITQS